MAGAVVILLSCGHRQELPARVLVEVSYCLKCQVLVKIESQREQWRYRCLDCRSARGFGAGQIAANLAADKHFRDRAHRVQVFEGARLDDVRTPRKFMIELPFGVDDPPF